MDQVDEKGKYFAANVANEPVIVVNDGGGDDIKAFFNVCRHHASRLCPDGSQGCTKQYLIFLGDIFVTLLFQNLRFECPYHGWTYSTSGRLTKATRLKGIQNFSAKNFGLIPVAVEKWGPFIFINLSSGGAKTRSLSQDFGQVQKSILDDCGAAFETGMHFVKRVIYDVESNWKVCFSKILQAIFGFFMYLSSGNTLFL